MKTNIGDNNDIKSSAIGKNNSVKIEEEKKNKAIKEIIIGVVVTIVGGIILAFVIKALNI